MNKEESTQFSRYLYMSKEDGLFSQSLKSLEIQLKTLFYGSGNQHAIRFLDSLSNLSIVEQEIALGVFQNVLDKLFSKQPRALSDEEASLKSIEDELYDSIVSEIQKSSAAHDKKKLEVLDGGRKSQPDKGLIDLSAARAKRKTPAKPVLN